MNNNEASALLAVLSKLKLSSIPNKALDIVELICELKEADLKLAEIQKELVGKFGAKEMDGLIRIEPDNPNKDAIVSALNELKDRESAVEPVKILSKADLIKLIESNPELTAGEMAVLKSQVFEQ